MEKGEFIFMVSNFYFKRVFGEGVIIRENNEGFFCVFFFLLFI